MTREDREIKDSKAPGGSAVAGIARRVKGSPHLVILAGLIVLGAALRFSTLDLQSFRYDEAVTVGRVLQPSLFDTFSAIPRSESTPPLYYLVAWLWSQPFGTGEVWIRSLSALIGTGTILVVYLGAVALPLPRRGALMAAAIVAVSPVLIWFSQDARAYALVILLSALSFLFFARARRSGARRDLAWWVAASALAIATHYFAFFVVFVETVLLLGGRYRRSAALAVLALCAAGLLLVPIAIKQADHGHASWIADQPIGKRLERAGAKLIGNDNGNEHGSRQPGRIPIYIPAALALAALMLLLWRGDPDERRGAGIAALVGAGGAGLPLLLAPVGADYFDGRNVLPAFAPLIVLLGAGFGVRRAGRSGMALVTAFCLCSLIFTLEINRRPRLQREDLRSAATEVGYFGPDVAVVTARYAANQPLSYYLDAQSAEAPLPPLREIVLIGSRQAADRDAGRILPPAFRRVEQKPVSYNYTLTRYRSNRRVRVPLWRLERGELVGDGQQSSVLLAPAPSP